MSGNIWYETNYSIYLDDVKVKDTQENTWGGSADKIEEMIVDDEPTAGVILGRKLSTYNGRPNSAQVADGIWVYTNFSRKDTKRKIEKFANQLGFKYSIKWK